MTKKLAWTCIRLTYTYGIPWKKLTTSTLEGQLLISVFLILKLYYVIVNIYLDPIRKNWWRQGVNNISDDETENNNVSSSLSAATWASSMMILREFSVHGAEQHPKFPSTFPSSFSYFGNFSLYFVISFMFLATIGFTSGLKISKYSP